MSDVTPSPEKIHDAVVQGGIYGPRCKPEVYWTVPLATEPRQVTCDECVEAWRRPSVQARRAMAYCGEMTS